MKGLKSKMLKDRYAVLDAENSDDTIYQVHTNKNDAYKEIGVNSGTKSEKRQIEIGKGLISDGYYRLIIIKGKALKKG
jgi:hypothetical protein